MILTATRSGVVVTDCKWCDGGHSSPWPRMRLAMVDRAVRASFHCPGGRKGRLELWLRLDVAAIALAAGARPIARCWNAKDDRAVERALNFSEHH
jgi:hypothetical protein